MPSRIFVLLKCLFFDFDANNDCGVDDGGGQAMGCMMWSVRAHGHSGFSLISQKWRYIRRETCIFVNERTKFWANLQ